MYLFIFFPQKETLENSVNCCLNKKNLDGVLNWGLVALVVSGFLGFIFLRISLGESHKDDFPILIVSWKRVKLLVKVSSHFLKCKHKVSYQIHENMQ